MTRRKAPTDNQKQRSQAESTTSVDDLLPLSAADFHILLVLSRGDLYGYAILQAVAEQSGGHVRPDLGALYRALARLETSSVLSAVAPPSSAAPSPGKARRYFGITAFGRQVLDAETERLRRAVDLASGRLGTQV